MFNNGIGIEFNFNTREFIYGTNNFGPITEKRKLDDIRKSLKNPNCNGPEIVYSIAMDVGLKEDREDLINRNLLYGACIYSNGMMDDEPVRSQGHIHAISSSCNYSTGELYEIWHGKAIIFMQESAKDNPGRVFVVEAEEGDVVFVPPGWAHYTVNASPENYMIFGAWCVRDYGFDYVDVRAHNGLSYFPIVKNGKIEFEKNPKYSECKLEIKKARKYEELKLDYTKSIYTQYRENRTKFDFVTNPFKYKEIWEKFIP
ncbi:glucose-6-phosphate isomerase family protein [Clostridium vincentii]|uniref:glucose-6-phosphate isomerase n=1 Tax=Clostridium vincentii TaxID=52704 RepID=A0A2T0BIA2_9CLOT|nr:glucose-6-phosphate isomerase family protein [Clostridium vincentii]PRR83604.1 glucose-6-phosphate isomerase [Clostridium vincentii]